MIDETTRNGGKINKDNDKLYLLFSFFWAEERKKISIENKKRIRQLWYAHSIAFVTLIN